MLDNGATERNGVISEKSHSLFKMRVARMSDYKEEDDKYF